RSNHGLCAVAYCQCRHAPARRFLILSHDATFADLNKDSDVPIRFVFALHNHQPVGNFDGVFEGAYRDSYAPFLELLEQYPEIPISLHTSGCLMEWLIEHKPEYVDRLRRFVARGQIEIMGGGFYEP